MKDCVDVESSRSPLIETSCLTQAVTICVDADAPENQNVEPELEVNMPRKATPIRLQTLEVRPANHSSVSGRAASCMLEQFCKIFYLWM